MSEQPAVTLEKDDGVAILRLNRPDNLNAYNPELHHALIAAFDQAEADDEVRAIIVTGEGRVFCAGADFSSGILEGAWSSIQPVEGGVERDGGGVIALRIFSCDKPVIGAINGAAIGFGATFTLPMDIRIASEKAKFSLPFTRRAICAESACSWFLPRIVGQAKALEWTLRGHMFSAEEALAGGLVSELTPPEELLSKALEIAKDMAHNCSPWSIATTKRLYWEGLMHNDPYRAHISESQALAAAREKDDFKEGVSAFFEKRQPVFGKKKD